MRTLGLVLFVLLTACQPAIVVPVVTGHRSQSGYVLAAQRLSPDCPVAPVRRLILNERGRVLPDDPRPLNLRNGAGIGDDIRVIRTIAIRTIFYVLEGPVCADGFLWYRVEFTGGNGWIAEGDDTSYYVEPYFPG
jgi:hypothetical protein